MLKIEGTKSDFEIEGFDNKIEVADNDFKIAETCFFDVELKPDTKEPTEFHNISASAQDIARSISPPVNDHWKKVGRLRSVRPKPSTELQGTEQDIAQSISPPVGSHGKKFGHPRRKKPKPKHPPFLKMITTAIASRKGWPKPKCKSVKRKLGMSAVEIKKYIFSNFDIVKSKRSNKQINLALRRGIANGTLIAASTNSMYRLSRKVMNPTLASKKAVSKKAVSKKAVSKKAVSKKAVPGKAVLLKAVSKKAVSETEQLGKSDTFVPTTTSSLLTNSGWQSETSNHMDSQAAKHKYNCPLCLEKFRSPTNVSQHLKLVHAGEKPYTCPQCPKKFRNACSVPVHIRVFHKGVKSHSCPECTKKFFNLPNLKLHLKSHKKVSERENIHVDDGLEEKAVIGSNVYDQPVTSPLPNSSNLVVVHTPNSIVIRYV